MAEAERLEVWTKGLVALEESQNGAMIIYGGWSVAARCETTRTVEF